MDRSDVKAVIRRLRHLTKWGWSAGDQMEDIQALLDHVTALEEEREEMQARIAELEVYEEQEMIGDPAGLGGPSISSSLRERDAAQASAEHIRRELAQAESRIHELEVDIRSHKRSCPMFR